VLEKRISDRLVENRIAIVAPPSGETSVEIGFDPLSGSDDHTRGAHLGQTARHILEVDGPG